MTATVNKQRLLATLFSTLKKRYGEPAGPADRPVLEQMVFAVLREGATKADADKAYARLLKTFFDWNEIRVSSMHEVEEALAELPHPAVRAQRVIALLQEVFESTFSFDLDMLSKKGLKQAAKQVGRYQAADDYTVAWVTQQSLGGHAIPIDQPTMRTAARLGLTDGETNPEAVRTSLEHQVPKAKAPQFIEYLSLLARDFCTEEAPKCSSCPMKPDCQTGVNYVERSRANGKKLKPR